MRKIFTVALVLTTSFAILSGCNLSKANGVGNNTTKSVRSVETTESENVNPKAFDESKLKIELNGHEVKLPCTVNEIINAGYKITEDSKINKDTILKPNEQSEAIDLVGNENLILVYAFNETNNDLKISQCRVRGLFASSLVGKHNDFKINGVGYKSSLNDVVKAVGTPTDSGDDYLYMGYKWIQYKVKDGKINIAFDGNKIKEFAYTYGFDELKD